ncbi:hypothetical protein ILYODFUR_016081 [Ilyodon furcidens]|uniref:Uncharacterized protein n=1 Tax=Ilyodon furcidens TaxID=33524 RepID=A0ABV0UTR3_9TELE
MKHKNSFCKTLIHSTTKHLTQKQTLTCLMYIYHFKHELLQKKRFVHNCVLLGKPRIDFGAPAQLLSLLIHWTGSAVIQFFLNSGKALMAQLQIGKSWTSHPAGTIMTTWLVLD